MTIDKGLLAEVAGLVLLFICVGVACTTESGRQGLAKVGIGAAAVLLRIAESVAGGAADTEKAERAGAARDVLRR